jgi:hypothetical protein
MSHSFTPRRPYLSDMTDKEWEFYKEVFPELRGIPGRWEAKWTTREMLMRYGIKSARDTHGVTCLMIFHPGQR